MADASVRVDQVLPGTTVFTDIDGNKGAVIDDGSLAYSVDNAALASVAMDTQGSGGDPTAFILTPVGTLGTVVVSMKATAKGGTVPLSDSKSVDITAGAAVAGTIVLGAPR